MLCGNVNLVESSLGFSCRFRTAQVGRVPGMFGYMDCLFVSILPPPIILAFGLLRSDTHLGRKDLASRSVRIPS
jgi:hypothetical protein